MPYVPGKETTKQRHFDNSRETSELFVKSVSHSLKLCGSVSLRIIVLFCLVSDLAAKAPCLAGGHGTC